MTGPPCHGTIKLYIGVKTRKKEFKLKKQYLTAIISESINSSNQISVEKLAATANNKELGRKEMDSLMNLINKMGLELVSNQVKKDEAPNKEKMEAAAVDPLSVYFAKMSDHKLIKKDREQELGEEILDNKKNLIKALCMSPVICQKFQSKLETLKEKEKFDILLTVRKTSSINLRNMDALIKEVSSLPKKTGKYVKDLNKGDISDYKAKKLESVLDSFAEKINFVQLKTASIKKYVKIMQETPAADHDFSSSLYKAHNKKIFSYVQKLEAAQNELIQSNLRLAVSVAKKYQNRGLEFSDLIQEANLGLMEAVDRFDYRFNLKFSTFATHWIRLFVGKSIDEKARTIRLPANIIEIKRKVVKATKEFQKENPGQMPTMKYLKKHTGESLDKIQLMLESDSDAMSLETPLGSEDENHTLYDVVSDTTISSPEDMVEHKKLNDNIEDVLTSTLNERDAEIIRMRFGINKDKMYTLEEIGEAYELTRERIRQIEAKALEKLQTQSCLDKLKEYVIG